MSTKIAAGFIIVVAAVAFGAASLASATAGQQSTQDKPLSLLSSSLYGVDNFHSYCSPCHGRDGKGDGPVAPALKRRPSDLTTLAKKNRGVFPRTQVREFITSGDPDVPEHGTLEMPVWGPTFRALDSSDRSVAIRIANVVEYLATIQQ
jgi:mono/diheme cytochrome c family protein